MLHSTQDFKQIPRMNAYQREKEAFTKIVKGAPRHFAPSDENIIFSHTVYQIRPKKTYRFNAGRK